MSLSFILHHVRRKTRRVCCKLFSLLRECETCRLVTGVLEGARLCSEPRMDYKKLRDLLEGFIGRNCEEYPDELDSIVKDTAKTGVVRLPWELLKPLLHYRLEKVLSTTFLGPHLDETCSNMSHQLLNQLDNFDNPPFTIQRVCELIEEPQKYYKKKDCYMRAMEKNLLVVSTQDPDLAWMKSPRLSQLLQEHPKKPEADKQLCDPRSGQTLFRPPKTSGVAHQHNSSANITTTTACWTNLREVSEPTQSEEPSTAVRSEREPVSSAPFRSELVSRKRTSSARDSMEEEEGNVTRTVLQEADSTVNIEQPQFESMEESPCKKSRDSCGAAKPSVKSLVTDGTMKSESERTQSGPESVESEHLEREGDRGSSDEVQPEANCRLKDADLVRQEDMEIN